MHRLTRLVETSTTQLGANRVEAIAGTSKLARDGHVIQMKNMDTSAFMRSGTILWSHDYSCPVGVPVSCRVDSEGNLRVVIDFAPAGLSVIADEIRDLVKAGIIRNLSIGFDVIDMEPLDPKKPRGGQLITRSELFEVSFVSVPADVGAVVTARGRLASGAPYRAPNICGGAFAYAAARAGHTMATYASGQHNTNDEWLERRRTIERLRREP